MNKKFFLYCGLVLIFIVAVVASLSLGVTTVSPVRVVKSLLGMDVGPETAIIISLRLPRLLLALTVGASLSVSGVVFQAILKNPLSDPFILGVSSGAGLGASIAIVLSLSGTFIAGGAFLGSIAISSFIFFVSKRRHFSSTSLILSGVSISFMCSAAMMLIFALSKASSVHKVFLWMMGDLSIGRYALLWKLAPVCVLIIVILFLFHRHLDVLSLGQEFAATLGVTEQQVQTLFWLASVLAALSVAMTGIIGFIGLIVPHVVRGLFGMSHKRTILLSALTGALFLSLCDIVGRTVNPPQEIPIGILTSFLGGMFFFVMLVQKGDRL